MHANSSRWKEALEMRQTMRDWKVMKRPGCSWMELDGLAYEFLVEDRLHCLQSYIYVILEEMAKHLETDTTDFFRGLLHL